MYRYEADVAEEILKENGIEYNILGAHESHRLDNIYLCHDFDENEHMRYEDHEYMHGVWQEIVSVRANVLGEDLFRLILERAVVPKVDDSNSTRYELRQWNRFLTNFEGKKSVREWKSGDRKVSVEDCLYSGIPAIECIAAGWAPVEVMEGIMHIQRHLRFEEFHTDNYVHNWNEKISKGLSKGLRDLIDYGLKVHYYDEYHEYRPLLDFYPTSYWMIDDSAFGDPSFVLCKEMFGCPTNKNDWDPKATALVGEWSDEEIEEESTRRQIGFTDINETEDEE